jgi:hypothetical protein
MYRLPRLAVAALLCLSACAAPPNKEMDQAQGAIDAAREVGAEQYAAAEYAAATASLQQARDAVAQRDYRLALNHALESGEHARAAAREAADTRARLRGEAERGIVEATALLAQANTRLTAGQRTLPRRTSRDAQRAIAQITADLQKAGTAVEQGDYLAAQPLLKGLKERIEKVLAALEPRAAAQSTRRRG